jgi:nucleotide-binding universal stress UspA family protein
VPVNPLSLWLLVAQDASLVARRWRAMFRRCFQPRSPGPEGKNGEVMNNIVVGTDGSEYATIAMRWAVDEARLHQATVEILLAWSLLDQYHPDRSDRFDPDYSEDAARATLAAWSAEAIGGTTDVAVSQRVVCDLPVRALLDAGDAADLLVLGARGRGGFEGLLLGSVSDRAAQLANRPVAVIRTSAPVQGGRVVVGIDGSPRSLAAMRWAAAEARARGSELDVVHAWRLPMMAGPAAATVFTDFSTLEASGRTILDGALADPALADVRVHGHLSYDTAPRALLDRAANAALLVAGTRGLGRVTGTLLGSVSRQLLHHAPCPVVVV